MTSNRKAWTLQSVVAPSYVNCAVLGRKSARVLATGGLDNKVNLWAVGKSGCIMTLSDHISPIQSLTFDNDENKLAAGSASGSIKIWDLDGSKEVRSLRGHKSAVTDLEFHSFGKFIATGSMDCNIKVWDINSKTCIFTYKGHTDKINCLRFSPDGMWLVSGGSDNMVKLWDLTAGKLLAEFQDHRDAITSVEFHPQDLLLATSSKDHLMKLYDLNDFKLVDSTQRNECSSSIDKLCFHPENNAIYAATNDFLKIFKSEPISCMDTVSVGWQNGFSDMALAANYNQLIGVSIVKSTVTTHVVDIQLCPPFVKIEPSENKNQKDTRPYTRCDSNKSRKSFCPDSTVNKQTLPKEHEKHHLLTDLDKEFALIEIQDPEEYERIFKKPSRLRQSPDHTNSALEIGKNEAQMNAALFNKQKNLRQNENDTDITVSTPEKKFEQVKKPDLPELKERKVDRIEPQKVPPSGDNVMSDDVCIDKLQGMHITVFNFLHSRQSNLSHVRTLWNPNNVTYSIDAAAKIGDLAVIVDLLSVLCQNSHLITLDVTLTLLNHLLTLVQSKHSRYVESACQILKITLKNFSNLVKQNICHPPTKVDVNREERYNKCKTIYDSLLLIRDVLSERSSDNMSPLFNEVLVLLNLLQS